MPDSTLILMTCTDIHFGAKVGKVNGSLSGPHMDRFVAHANTLAVDLVVDLGDRIPDDKNTDLAVDLKYLVDLNFYFQKLDVPFDAVLGNHDVRRLTAETNSNILGVPSESHSYDINGYHLIFWNPDLIKPFEISSDHLQWLETNLYEASNPCILFTHIPLHSSGRPSGENPKFDSYTNAPLHMTFPQASAARNILEASGKVILCEAGHLHRPHPICKTINGIPYVAQGSLSRAYNENAIYGTYGLTTVTPAQITYQTYGIGAATYIHKRTNEPLVSSLGL